MVQTPKCLPLTRGDLLIPSSCLPYLKGIWDWAGAGQSEPIIGQILSMGQAKDIKQKIGGLLRVLKSKGVSPVNTIQSGCVTPLLLTTLNCS